MLRYVSDTNTFYAFFRVFLGGTSVPQRFLKLRRISDDDDDC